MNIKKYFFLPIFFALSLHAHSVYIIIHGTWASKYPWHMPQGDFFDALERSLLPHHASVVSFLWSGKLDHNSRTTAAQCLVKLIKSYPTSTRIIIVAHSHGANVGIIASQQLAKDAKNKHSIYSFYALGTPVNCESYMPNMKIITYFYNLFSYDDFVQSCLGIFGREYPLHERVANIRITIDGKYPSHSELHSPIVAQWLTGIHELYQKNNNGNFGSFLFKKPGIIHFTNDKLPLYAVDIEREQLRKQDRQLENQLQMGLIEQVMRTHKVRKSLPSSHLLQFYQEFH